MCGGVEKNAEDALLNGNGCGRMDPMLPALTKVKRVHSSTAPEMHNGEMVFLKRFKVP